MSTAALTWPAADFSRIPYRVFTAAGVFEREQERLFRGPVWCYLALEAEIPMPGDFVTTFVGNAPVVIDRAEDGSLHAFVNRCAHRGTTLVRQPAGNTQDHTCIYHHWCYDLKGNLIGVPFERGMNGQGGMPRDFDKADHGLNTLTLATYRGVIFGSFDAGVAPLEDYLGAPMRRFLDRLFAKPVEILGYTRQRVASNWKLYWENVSDHYHAGLLHQFSTTFGFYRPLQESGATLDEQTRHVNMYAVYGTDDLAEVAEAYKDLSAYDESYTLEDPAIIDFRDEEGDARGFDMIDVFPSVIIQRISNALATRHVRPKSANEFELYWTYFGYADDDPELRRMRLQQANVVGPSGLISMEDAEATSQVQRALSREPDPDAHSVIEMGGLGPIESQEHSITEVPLRAFWKSYCELMGYEAGAAAS